MSKVSVAFALISTLAFTSANAPTFQLWRDLPAADLILAEELISSHALYEPDALFAFNSLNQQLSEDDALDRFEVDDMYLPKLNVELPELFDWSDIENTYFAQEIPTLVGPPSFAVDNYGGGAFRVASLGVTGGVGANIASSTRFSSTAQQATHAQQATQSLGKGSGDPEQNTSDPRLEDVAIAGDAQPDSQQLASNDVAENPIDQIVQLPTEPAMTDMLIGAAAPIASKDPVQVPAPGACGLFVLGLAGLRLAVRKKNGSG
jgi:hypothetical protein